MDRKEFFIQLHKELAEKYPLDPIDIVTIRILSLNYKMDRKDIALRAAEKLTKKRTRVGKRVDHYQRVVNFLASCTDSQYQDIVQKTKYDQ